jgi:acetyl-CoA decarbonylase/synthase complex subunit delta
MERISQAGLSQEDDKLQIPMINNLGNETWRCKEAGLPKDEMPTMGDPGRRAILMEAVAAVCYLLAGSDILIMRHPESIKLAREMIDDLMREG